MTLEGSGVLLHDGVLLERSDHFLHKEDRLNGAKRCCCVSPSVLFAFLQPEAEKGEAGEVSRSIRSFDS